MEGPLSPCSVPFPWSSVSPSFPYLRVPCPFCSAPPRVPSSLSCLPLGFLPHGWSPFSPAVSSVVLPWPLTHRPLMGLRSGLLSPSLLPPGCVPPLSVPEAHLTLFICPNERFSTGVPRHTVAPRQFRKQQLLTTQSGRGLLFP